MVPAHNMWKRALQFLSIVLIIVGTIALLNNGFQAGALRLSTTAGISSPVVINLPVPFLGISQTPRKRAHSRIELKLYKKNHQQRENQTPILLHDGDAVYEGDEVQVQYTTPFNYGAIISVDGRGVVTRHYPDVDAANTRIRKGTHVLPFAFKLDDAPGFEAFFFISSDLPVSLSAILSDISRFASKNETLHFSGNSQVKKVLLQKLPRGSKRE